MSTKTQPDAPELKLHHKATPTEIISFLIATDGYVVRTKDRLATAHSRKAGGFACLILDSTVDKMISDGLLCLIGPPDNGKSQRYELTEAAKTAAVQALS